MSVFLTQIVIVTRVDFVRKKEIKEIIQFTLERRLISQSLSFTPGGLSECSTHLDHDFHSSQYCVSFSFLEYLIKVEGKYSSLAFINAKIEFLK